MKSFPATLARRREVVEAAALCALLGLFLFLALSFFRSSGMTPDEVLDESAAAAWAEGLRTGEATWLDFFGAIRYRFYHGEVQRVIMTPFFWVFGKSLALHRVWPAACAVAMLLILHVFLREAFDRRVALTAVFLLVIHPSFTLAAKTGVLNFMLLFSTGAVFCLWRWRGRGEAGWLFAAWLLAGLGLGTRVWFGYFAAGLIAASLAAAVVGRKRLEPRRLWAAPLGFFLGVLPVWRAEAPAGFPSWIALTQMRIRPEALAGRHVSLFDNFSDLLGTPILAWMVDLDLPRGSDLYLWAAALSPVACLLWAKKPWRETMRWILVLEAAMLGLCLLSRKPQSHHLFVFHPFLQIGMAVALVSCFGAPRAWRGRLACGALALAALAAGDLRVWNDYFSAMRRQDGLSPYARMIGELGEFAASGKLLVSEREETMLYLYLPGVRRADMEWASGRVLKRLDDYRKPTRLWDQRRRRPLPLYLPPSEASRKFEAAWEAELARHSWKRAYWAKTNDYFDGNLCSGYFLKDWAERRGKAWRLAKTIQGPTETWEVYELAL